MDALVTLTGNVGTEIELRQNGWSAASFRLAHTPRFTKDGTWVNGETTWITVDTYRALAEHVAHSVSKGDPVMVVGRLRTKSWTDRATGEVQERLVIEAISVGHDLSKGVAMFRRTAPSVSQHAGSDRLSPRSDTADVADSADPGEFEELESRESDAGDSEAGDREAGATSVAA